MIRENFSGTTYWVVAEVSGLRYYAGKNYYFLNLVEKAGSSNTLLTSISATAWSQGVNNIRKFESVTGQKFEDNLQLLLQVRVEYHITYGLKLNVLDVDPQFTLGKLAMEKQKTLNRLVAENPGFVSFVDGEFTSFNQSRLPGAVIQRIALLGSPGTDGVRDFMHELESNYFGYAFSVDAYPSTVQGAGAEMQLVERLVEIIKLGIEYDAVVIVRGGGADTDLMAFDGYLLSKAVARFPIPVLTGIGHTRNESVTDMMAFRSLKTPTKTAAFIIEHNRVFEEDMEKGWKQISGCATALVSREREKLYYFKSGLQGSMREVAFVHQEKLTHLRNRLASGALTGLRSKGSEVQMLNQVLRQAAKHFLVVQSRTLENLHQAFKMMGPERILKRGFALVYNGDKAIKDAADLQLGSTIKTVFFKGEITSVVTSKTLKNGKADL